MRSITTAGLLFRRKAREGPERRPPELETPVWEGLMDWMGQHSAGKHVEAWHSLDLVNKGDGQIGRD